MGVLSEFGNGAGRCLDVDEGKGWTQSPNGAFYGAHLEEAISLTQLRVRRTAQSLGKRLERFKKEAERVFSTPRK